MRGEGCGDLGKESPSASAQRLGEVEEGEANVFRGTSLGVSPGKPLLLGGSGGWSGEMTSPPHPRPTGQPLRLSS